MGARMNYKRAADQSRVGRQRRDATTIRIVDILASRKPPRKKVVIPASEVIARLKARK